MFLHIMQVAKQCIFNHINSLHVLIYVKLPSEPACLEDYVMQQITRTHMPLIWHRELGLCEV